MIENLWANMEVKHCKYCNQDKLLKDFRKCKYSSGKFYHKAICKKCEIKKINEYVKRRGPVNKTPEQKRKQSEYKKKWKLQNKERLNRQYRERIKSDPFFRLRKNISREICRRLKNNDSKKDSSITNYLEYSIDELMLHLEKQFDDKMNWENYGKYWHLDHKIPQSCLPYKKMSDENFKKCWALSNLRPLEAKLNMLEGSTRIRHKIYKSQGDL
jgi:hypothetical protein